MHHAAHKKRRIKPADLAHPRSDARRRRLAVRPRNHRRTPSANKLFTHSLGLRAIFKLAVQHFLELRIAAHDRVANNSDVAREVCVLGLIA